MSETTLELLRRLDGNLELLQERLGMAVGNAIVTGITATGDTRTFVVAGVTYAANGAPQLWDGCDLETAIHLDNVINLRTVAVVRNATAPSAPGRST